MSEFMCLSGGRQRDNISRTFPDAINMILVKAIETMTVLGKQINFLPSISIIDDFIFLKVSPSRSALADDWLELVENDHFID